MNGWDGRPRSGPFSVRSKGRQGGKKGFTTTTASLQFVMASPRNVVPAVGRRMTGTTEESRQCVWVGGLHPPEVSGW